MIKTLKEFQFVDEYGKDQGANVRQKAKDISNLLTDEARLRQERRSRAHMRDRMVGEAGADDDEGGNENTQRRSRSAPPRRQGNNPDDELRRAIEESKRSLAAEQAKQGHMTAEERDLAEAIKLSEEEEKKRHQQQEDATQSALFDDSQPYVFTLCQVFSCTLTVINSAQSNPNNPFPLIDTGLQAQYTQQLQPQFTAVPVQYTSFNPYQQQMQQEAMQVCSLLALNTFRTLMFPYRQSTRVSSKSGNYSNSRPKCNNKLSCNNSNSKKNGCVSNRCFSSSNSNSSSHPSSH